jgi:hypothetical protein
VIPPLPPVFDAEHAPVGVDVKFLSYWQSRPLLPAPPRLQLAHTNGASVESSIEGQVRWAEANPGVNTAPHYVLDRQGRARKCLPTDRRGIANATVTSGSAYAALPATERVSIAAHGNVRDWSLAYETTDLGWPTPGGAAGYTPAQGETLATIFAYESITHGIPLEVPEQWHESGTASHTDPYGYPFWTIAKGKACPGAQKKEDLRLWVLPRAREIRDGWLSDVGGDGEFPDPEDNEMTADQANEAHATFLMMTELLDIAKRMEQRWTQDHANEVHATFLGVSGLE